jgi:hypothetical protein
VAEVAARLGVHRSGLARKEAGQTDVSRVDLMAWSQVFDIPLEALELAAQTGLLTEPTAEHASDDHYITPMLGSAGGGIQSTARVVYMGPVVKVTVVGDSMSPALEDGWVVSVRRCEWSSIQPGDIVLVVWGQSQDAAFFEAFPRLDGSVRLLKRNTRYAQHEHSLDAEQVMSLIASVSKVVGVVQAKRGDQ